VIKPCGFQLAQMFQERRQRHVMRPTNSSPTLAGPQAQLLHDCAARRITQREKTVSICSLPLAITLAG
jgi:hypothetical protein